MKARIARLVKRLRQSLSKQIEAHHILGIACTGHGASLAYLGRDGTVRCSVLDRWAGVKNVLMLAQEEEQQIRHAEDPMHREIRASLIAGLRRFPDTRTFEETIVPWSEWLLRGTGIGRGDIDLLAVSDCHFATNTWRLGRRLGRWFPAAHIERHIEHHEIHQRQAFWQSGFERAAVLTLDTCGEKLMRLGDRQLSGTIAILDRNGEETVLSEMLYPESSPGFYYDLVTDHVGFEFQGEQGKTMGLAPYGSPVLFERLQHRLLLHEDGSFTFVPPGELEAIFAEHVPKRQPRTEILDGHRDVAYLGQALLERIVAHSFATALRLTGVPDLVYAGGVALNSVANEIANRHARPRRLYVAPNPGDPGHALGCALWCAHERAGWPAPAETPEYLGPCYTEEEMERDARASGFPVCRPEAVEEVLARCIANGHIVARFDGGAEFGPRALGNRSILCDPRRPDMKDYLNARVKHRESFRPFAPTVLLEHAGDWFDLAGRSPYMLRVVAVHEPVRERIPAVVHVDGTARVQTVTREENPGYFELIAAFHRQTGVPLVLNTSFNVAGQPIVETPEQAVRSFSGTAIDVLALGPFLLSKGPLERYLEHPR